MLDLELDPKLTWALEDRERFPVDVNRADKEVLLRVPGLDVKSVQSLLNARRYRRLKIEDLARLKISVWKVKPFIVTDDWTPIKLIDRANLREAFAPAPEQLVLL